MKQWQAIIIDDEPLARMELNRLLKPFDHISIVGEADSVNSAKITIEKLSPDLVFLDIDLGTQTGFDLLELLPRNFHLIFVTAFDEYAIRAFKVNALDYLLKPVHPARLKETIARLGNPYTQEVDFILKPFDKILLSNINCSKLIPVDSISFIEAKGDYTKVNTISGFSGIVHQTIKKWLERLPDKLFVQIHRSYIANTSHIKELQKKNKDSLEILFNYSPMKVPVSRNYSKLLKSKFEIK